MTASPLKSPGYMWLIVSSLSRHNPHLLFSCVLSASSYLLLPVFCVAIRRDSASLSTFPFLSHVQVFFPLFVVWNYYSTSMRVFSHQLMVFHWSLSDCKSLQVTRTLLSILVDLNYSVVWMIFTCYLISKSSSSCTNPFVPVPSSPITIGITVTFMSHSFFRSQARSRYLCLFSFSFNFTLWSVGAAKSIIWQVLFFVDNL